MGIIKVPQEVKIEGVKPSRLFRAMITNESYSLLPKVMPAVIKSMEVLEGDGGPGSIRQSTFHEVAPYSYVKYKVDTLDPVNLTTKYTLFEGPALGDKLESIHYDVKFEELGVGGCIVKIINEYHTKGNVELKEEEIEARTEQAKGYYTVTAAYLIAHPEACA